MDTFQEIPLFRRRPDLLDYPPVLARLPGGRRALKFEAPAIDDQPAVILYINVFYARVEFGYSFHYEDGLIEEYIGPYGDPDRDRNQPHGHREG